VGVDSAWEQDAKRLEARKMLENAAESHMSDACFVRRLLSDNASLNITTSPLDQWIGIAIKN
jgi:hypothetical protein